MSTPATSHACNTDMPLGILTGYPSTNTSIASSGLAKWIRAPPTGVRGGSTGAGSGWAAVDCSGFWSSGVNETIVLWREKKGPGFWEPRRSLAALGLKALEARDPNPISLSLSDASLCVFDFVFKVNEIEIEIEMV